MVVGVVMTVGAVEVLLVVAVVVVVVVVVAVVMALIFGDGVGGIDDNRNKEI
ncbi:hypothetical protein E2C01_069688 [Portunus trituberculatus]|uniref:Transmembrane protein n=1 Tax=Portunus trituberculatus TaxID=210409 RepID=A0A5B7HZ82_PORTR|nr:hypothetical protein [Portunus trituberculatus]